MKYQSRNILATFALCSLTLSSCGLYTKFSPEEIQADVAGENITLPDTAVVALPTWQEVFTDSHLQGLITKALEQNADLEVARLNTEQAKRVLTTSKLAYVPSLIFSPEISKGIDIPMSYKLPVAASWELDLFGRLRNQKRQAQAAFEQTKAYKQAVQSQLIAGVATNYYSLLLADKQLAWTRESYAILESTLTTIEALKDAGMQTQAAVLQTRGNLKDLEITLYSLEQQVALLENNLCLLLQEAPRTIFRGSLEETIIDYPISETMSLAVLSNRPDIKVAEMNLAKSFYGVNYARASLYPKITLSAQGGWFNPGDWLLQALASATQPIFMAGVNRANLANAKDAYEQQLVLFEQSLLKAGKEVNDAIINQYNASIQKGLALEQVTTYHKAVETTQALMDTGMASYLEVLTAQNAYLGSRINQAKIWHSLAISQIDLFNALGGGQE